MTDVAKEFAVWCVHRAYRPCAAAMKLFYEETERVRRGGGQAECAVRQVDAQQKRAHRERTAMDAAALCAEIADRVRRNAV